MISRIEAIHWSEYAQPEWNNSRSVPDALAQLIGAADAESGSFAYDSFLFAVGNNHAGTYYPVLIAAMPFVEEVAVRGPRWPQRSALSVLNDLFGSFHPEPGYEKALLPDIGLQEIETLFRQRVRAFGSSLADIAGGQKPNSQVARDLLDLLTEDAA